jgi:deoxyribonuclease-4
MESLSRLQKLAADRQIRCLVAGSSDPAGASRDPPSLSRSRIPSRGGSHACPEQGRRAAGSRAWEPALLQNRDLLSLLFGTAGVPFSSPKPDSRTGIAHIRELGLDCMELAWVRRVSMGEKTAAKVRQKAEECRVALSVHAPYYINLNSAEASKVEASRRRILKAARAGWLCGARNIVFHAAFYHNDPPGVVYERVRGHLVELTQELRAEGNGTVLRPETTGKQSQFGTLEELLALSREVEGVAPCVDFAHLHARAGKNNSYEEFVAILGSVEKELGQAGLSDMHIHLSGIEYGPKGERKHLMLDEADMRYVEVLQALGEFGVKGLLICESPFQEVDALILQEAYYQLENR